MCVTVILTEKMQNVITMVHTNYIHTNLYSDKNRENEPEAVVTLTT